MALIVRDGNNNSVTLKTTAQIGEQTPHHFIDGTSAVSGIISINNDGADILDVYQSHLYTTSASMVNDLSVLTTTGNLEIMAAPGPSLRYYITSLSISNASASGFRVDIRDGSTAFFSAYAAAQGGGAVMQFPVPVKCTLNTAVNGSLSSNISGCIVSIQGYTGS